MLIAVFIAAATERGGNRRLRLGLAAGLTLAFGAGLAWVQHVVGHRFRFMLFGTFRFGLLVDHLPAAYVLPLALGLGGGFTALFSREASTRQLGAGALIWLAAGFAPHTPIQLLYLVLGAVLLTRSAQARDPVGAWRRRSPWTRLIAEPMASPPSEEPADEAASEERG